MDKDTLFIMIALFNTGIGLSNFYKNEEQQNKQNSIEEKLDRIIALLESEGIGSD